MTINDNLLFRRQFILGNEFVEKIPNGVKLKINENLFLTVHPDLEASQLNDGSKSLTLLGFIIDPNNPQLNNQDIIKRIFNTVSDFNALLSLSYDYSGRWIMIYNDEKETKVFHDPCGSRKIFYYFDDSGVCCGSQPNIINQKINDEINDDTSLQRYIRSEKFESSERFWVGEETIYKNIKQLLPNHYLDLKEKVTKRYWINKENDLSFDQAVEEASKILRGSLSAISNRSKLMLPVTAGWDSRVLLAASKDIKEDVYYFVNSMNVYSDKHMDIRVPKNLLDSLGLELNVHRDMMSLREDFMRIIDNNVALARNLPKTLAIQYYYDFLSDKINVNGNGSEIARNFYGNNHPPIDKIDSNYIMDAINFSTDTPYIKQKINEWLSNAKKVSRENDLGIMDLFYWEQRMGNWGSMFQAEQDIAVEGFMPFNNRKLLMILLSVNNKYRNSPDYIFYKKLIEHMWTDTLKEPINPVSIKTKVRKKIAKMLPNNVKGKVKSLVKL